MDTNPRANNKDLAVFLLLIGLGYAGLVKFLFMDYLYPLDWLHRLLILAVFCYFYREDISLPGPVAAYLTFANFRSVVLATLLILVGKRTIDVAAGITQLYLIWDWFHYPLLKAGLLKSIDLTFGVVLVAVTEELVYRKLALRVISQWSRNPWVIYLASSLIFASLHIPQGLDSVAIAFVAGLFLMHAYRSRGTLLVPIAAHYFVDLYIFI